MDYRTEELEKESR